MFSKLCLLKVISCHRCALLYETLRFRKKLKVNLLKLPLADYWTIQLIYKKTVLQRFLYRKRYNTY